MRTSQKGDDDDKDVNIKITYQKNGYLQGRNEERKEGNA